MQLIGAKAGDGLSAGPGTGCLARLHCAAQTWQPRNLFHSGLSQACRTVLKWKPSSFLRANQTLDTVQRSFLTTIEATKCCRSEQSTILSAAPLLLQLCKILQLYFSVTTGEDAPSLSYYCFTGMLPLQFGQCAMRLQSAVPRPDPDVLGRASRTTGHGSVYLARRI